MERTPPTLFTVAATNPPRPDKATWSDVEDFIFWLEPGAILIETRTRVDGEVTWRYVRVFRASMNRIRYGECDVNGALYGELESLQMPTSVRRVVESKRGKLTFERTDSVIRLVHVRDYVAPLD